MADMAKKTTENPNTRHNALREQLDTLEGDIRSVADDVENVADHRVKKVIGKAEEIARNACRFAEEMAGNTGHDVDKWAHNKLDRARTSVRRRPFLVLALSIGIGALIGAWAVRR